MANQPRFETEDVERLFRALLPTNRPDPFGEIETRLLELGEALVEGEEETQTFRDFIKEELDDIKNRTFGIMILQIFRTLKFFFGLLPQGRIILLVIAGMGLATTLLQGDRPTFSDVREAVKSTGIGDFIDGVMAELQRITDETEESLKGTAQEIVRMFNGMTADTSFLEAELSNARASLESIVVSFTGDTQSLIAGAEEPVDARPTVRQLQNVLATLDAMASPLEQVTNVASNGALFLPAILRALEDRIRAIPGLAAKLVSL